MAKGYGFFGGLVDGMESADRSVLASKQAKAADLAAQKAQGELDDSQKMRGNAAAAESALSRAMNPGNPEFTQDTFMRSEKATANDTEQPAAAVAPVAPTRIHDAYDKVAMDAFRRGDAATGTKFMEAAAAQKTNYYTQAFNDSWRKQDVPGMLDILNDFPNGQKYDAQVDPETGKIVARAMTMDGQPIGQPVMFDSIAKMGEFVQQRINPGDIYKRNLEDAKLRLEQTKTDAQANRDNAAAKAEGERAIGMGIDNDLSNRFGAQERQARINQANASASASGASAGLASAQAGVVGQTPEMRNFGYRTTLTPEQQAQFDAVGRSGAGVTQDPTVVAAQKALLEAYVDPVKQSSLSADQKLLAQELLAKANGASLLKKNTGAGFNQPAGSGAPTVANALQQARDAIARGASKDKVIERLKQSGIDPKGL